MEMEPCWTNNSEQGFQGLFKTNFSMLGIWMVAPLLDVLMSICCRGRDVTRFNLEVTGLNLSKVTKILNQLCLQVPDSVGVDGRALFNDVSAEPIE
jgi:hypothetical protein